jgi:hypothetical protein
MTMKHMFAIALIALGWMQSAHAHDIDKELAAFATVYASKDPGSTEARAAKLLVEQAQAFFQYSDKDQVLHIRSLTNKGLAAIGEPTASLANELKRLEAAVAKPKTSDPAKIAEARRLLEEAKSEKAAYDLIEKAVFSNLKQAMQLLQTAK